MTIQEAIRQRHTVRKYHDRSIPDGLVKQLNARIAENNEKFHLAMRLVTGNADGLNGMARLLLAKNVNNYIILAGENAPSLDERLGYRGADIILHAQTLGLNTWWIGGMFSRKGAEKNLQSSGAKISGIIAIGYGLTQGAPHKSKTAAEVSQYNGEAPQWFLDGVEALLYAPTALNKQAYTVRGDGNKVSLTYGGGHFAGIDLGIGKYHFEAGAGKENFEWV